MGVKVQLHETWPSYDARLLPVHEERLSPESLGNTRETHLFIDANTNRIGEENLTFQSAFESPTCRSRGVDAARRPNIRRRHGQCGGTHKVRYSRASHLLARARSRHANTGVRENPPGMRLLRA